jgi:hypothetical protein
MANQRSLVNVRAHSLYRLTISHHALNWVCSFQVSKKVEWFPSLESRIAFKWFSLCSRSIRWTRGPGVALNSGVHFSFSSCRDDPGRFWSVFSCSGYIPSAHSQKTCSLVKYKIRVESRRSWKIQPRVFLSTSR